MKIAVNRCWGGFGVSDKVIAELDIQNEMYFSLNNDMFGIESPNMYEYRACPRLISAIEKIGEEESSDPLANIEIIEIPDGVDWEIDDYDGMETIREVHLSW